MKQVFKTRKAAEMAAKREACEMAGINFRSNLQFLDSNRLPGRQYDGRCHCGVTSAEMWTVFYGPLRQEQKVSSLVSYCKYCGQN